MIDVKYFAGFVDSDGSISIHVQKRDNDRYGLYPKVNIGQLTFRDYNLKELAEVFDVNLRYREDTKLTLIDLTGNKARRFIELIKNHLVIKDELAEYVLTLPKEVNKEELKSIKKVVKSLRKKTTPTKNHPSRKWLAGYLDGDGCLYAKVTKSGVLNTKLLVSSAVDAQAGLKLIQKAFGGYINISGNAARLEIHLGVSKTKELYEFCGKHLRIKKTQMVLINDYVGSNKHSKSHGATYSDNKQFCETLATTKYIGRK
jgi:hypothetical protein